MASVPLLSTGRDTAVYLDNSQVNRSAEKLQSEIIGTEKLKLNKALQEEQDFMKAIQVDPVALMTQMGIQKQSEKIDEFNKTWTEEMRKSKGVLSTEQKIRMQQEKVGVQSYQQNLAGSQQRWLEETKAYQSNPSKYSEEDYLKGTAEFFTTGNFTTALRKKPAIFIDGLNKSITAVQRKAGSTAAKTGTQGGMNIITTTKGTEEEGKREFLNFLFGSDDSDAYLEFLAGQFVKEDAKTQEKYYDAAYDVNKDGIISRKELELSSGSDDADAVASNPIVRWATDTYGAQYVKSDQTMRNQPSSPFIGGSGNEMIFTYNGKKYFTNVPDKPEVYQMSEDRPASTEFYSTTDYPVAKTYRLGINAKLVDEGTEDDVDVGKSVEAKILGYDAEGDNILLQPTSNDGSFKTSQTIIVPRKSILGDMPPLYIIKEGKRVLVNSIVNAPKGGIFDNLGQNNGR